MASLLTIPLELLVAVSSHLTTPDLGALRLTCKQIEKSLYEWFSKEFFTKKQFMLTHKSLQALVDISKHASFSQKLSHLIIATNVYEDKPFRFRDEDAAARYKQGWEDQKTLLTTGLDRDMLTEAFRRLVNLQTVGIRDFNNHERSRDGINWTSWGATTVKEETGIDLVFTNGSLYGPQNANAFLSHLYQNLILALAHASCKPAELEVLLRHSSLPDTAFNIPNFVLPTVRPLLFGLKKLFLKVDTDSDYSHLHTSGPPIETQSGPLLRHFLGHTQNLTHLRLNLPRHTFEKNEQFCKWLSLPVATLGSASKPSFFDPPPIKLEHLVALDMGQFHVRSGVILDVIAKFAPTLQDLNLWKLNVTEPGAFPSNDPDGNIWAKIFLRMIKIPYLQLRHIKVGMLGQNHAYVQFKDANLPDAPPLKAREYSGDKMEVFLRALSEEATVVWPPGMHNNQNDDDSEEEEEDEDEDMIDGNDDEDDEDEENDDNDE
ncbi:hypothetical protein IQ06DRAFT_291013 [Phaeosphaeriaceae sp. SRC1lsM3a]|nr:hypothetical protein IQ06DRAFT_291013 [Stagonospora sp. SRC1lsM3a]